MVDLKRHFLAAVLIVFAQALAAATPQKVTSVEGVTEYRLANGLRVLTLPDPGIDTVTVHIVYLVGSRHEGYGEKGMAHLLEHLLFKSSKNHPDIKSEYTRRGSRWNGTTSNDRTNYFQTLSATTENLEWAIALEADRMVNATVSKPQLDAEMTVVRNEFEMGENSPGSVLFQRMQQAAFVWHNYGNPIIGERSNIENVPIGRLQRFYKTWYQPDNAVLIVAGRFDEAQALALVQKHFGAIPRPARALPGVYTEEPTQDGEREVILRRIGENQVVSTLYRVAAGSHPDYPAIDVLVHILGDAPTGRLHRELVQKGLASVVWASERGLHDPGFVYFGAALAKDAKLEPAREALVRAVETLEKAPVTGEEVDRARTRLLNEFEKVELDTSSMVRALSEFQAIGDWRLLFLYRDRLRKVTVADVQRMAEHYLKPANRVLGTFVPTENPDRAPIPAAPELQAQLKDYKGGESVRLGEAFDPSPQNIEKRLVRRRLANDMRALLLPKQTRGGRVLASLSLHIGDEKSLTNREIACDFAGAMLSRGTLKRSRAEFKDELARLSASVSLGEQGAAIEVRRENLVPALRLVAEALREPAFPPAEFEEMKRAAIVGAESELSDPSALARVHLARHLSDYPEGHPHWTPTIEERIARMRAVTLEDAKACHRELMGATRADFVAVGDFDPDEVARAVDELFGAWRTPHPFQRVPWRYFERPSLENELVTPDKANAVLRAGLNVRMRDDHPDFPALVLANYLLGGSSTGRIPARVREKEGLSYSTYTTFLSNPFDAAADFRVSSIFAPQNRERVERAIREEMSRAVREGFTKAEVEAGKHSVLQARRLARMDDRALSGRLASYSFAGRTFAWDIALEKKIASLTPAEVNAALKKHIDPARLAVILAGDFKKSASAGGK